MLNKLPGDQKITKLFGFPGFEALIATVNKHINTLRKKHGLTEITYKKFITEIEVEAAAITKKSEELGG